MYKILITAWVQGMTPFSTVVSYDNQDRAEKAIELITEASMKSMSDIHYEVVPLFVVR